MKRIYAIQAWCLDCKRCEIACKTFHSKSKNVVKAFKLESPQPQQRIRVEGAKTTSIAISCRHCEDPRCIMGCISGAMRKDPATGLVYSDPEKCVGCRTCVSMCPFGAVHVEEVYAKGYAFKCDLCGDAPGQPGTPSCVAACPNRALIYVESEAIS